MSRRHSRSHGWCCHPRLLCQFPSRDTRWSSNLNVINIGVPVSLQPLLFPVTSPEKKGGDYAQSRGFMQSLWNAIQGRTDCGHLSFTSLHRWGNKSLDAVMRILSSRLNVIDKTVSEFMVLPRGNNGLYDCNFINYSSCLLQFLVKNCVADDLKNSFCWGNLTCPSLAMS